MAVDVLRLPTAGGLSTALHKHSLSLPAVASGRRPRRGKSVLSDGQGTCQHRNYTSYRSATLDVRLIMTLPTRR